MPAVRMSFALDAERGRLRYVNTETLRLPEIKPLNLKIHVAMCWNFAKSAIREEFGLLELWFDYPLPTYPKAYQDYYECGCRFDMPIRLLRQPWSKNANWR